LNAAPLPLGLLSDLARACSACDPGPADAEPRDWFNELLAHQAAARLADQHAVLARITAAGGQALLAARAGRTVQAWDHIHHARALLGSAGLRPETHRLAHTLICAQHAYLCYRSDDDAQAQILLAAACRDDVALESLPGYGFLQIHRIQLLHNVMRIHRTRGRMRPALQLGHALLSYLEHPSPPILAALPEPWNGPWHGSFPDTPQALVAALHGQIAAEMVALATAATDPRCLAAALRALPAGPPSQAARWAAFQLARLAGGLQDMMAAALPLLRQGPVPSRPLWHAAATGIRTCLAAQLDLLAQAE